MKSRIRKVMAALVAAACGAMLLIVGSAGSSTATTPRLQAFGITADGLSMAAFRVDTPNVLDWVQDIAGLDPNTYAIGLDVRVQDGLLYLVDNLGGIYSVTLSDGSGPVVATKVSKLTVPKLDGTLFGVDFNPAADRLRIVSDRGQNLRHDLNTHTTITDAPLTGAQGISSAAYTNNDLAPATGTTLFDIGPVTDQVFIQSPPNNGNLVPTGSLTYNAGPNTGFDIWADLSNGRTVANLGFASLTVNNAAGLYSVNMLTGEATFIGNFPRLVQLTDIALALDTNP